MVIGYGELRRGITIELEGEPYQVEEFSHVKMQQRAPVIRIKLRSVRTGRAMERSFQGYDIKLNLAQVQNRHAQYIYKDDQHHHFMDLESFEQYPMSAEQLGDAVRFLTEQAEVDLVVYQGSPIAVQLPTYVELEVVDTPPGYKGDTATGGTKPATLETGMTLQVPLFVNPGERVKVDTRTGEYLERAG